MAPSQVIISQGSIWLSIQTSNCFPIGGCEYVTKSHASTTYHVLTSCNNEIDLSWTYQSAEQKPVDKHEWSNKHKPRKLLLEMWPSSLEVFKLFLISDWQNGKETIVSKNNSEPICERTPRACHFMNETLPFEWALRLKIQFHTIKTGLHVGTVYTGWWFTWDFRKCSYWSGAG
jgi:hypothetical protein